MGRGTLATVLLATALVACGRIGIDPQAGGDAGAAPVVGFAFSTSLTDESATTHAVAVVLSEPATQTVTVEVTAIGGTANEDSDYILGSRRVTLLPGETQGDLLITILDDGMEEPDETIALHLGTPTNARVGHADHEVTISSQILPRVSFDTATTSAPENAGAQSFVVQLDVAAAADVRVAYTVAGTASLADHQFTTGMLTIPAGQLSVTLDGGIVDDVMDEYDETIRLSLTAQTGAVIGAIALHVHTIADEDPPPNVGFLMTAGSAEESSGDGMIKVELDVPSGKPVAVDVALTGGSAMPGVDFTGDGGTLSFPPGATTASVPIAVIDDVFDEENESAVLTLSNAQDATIPAVASSFTLSIIDDDPPPTLSFVNNAELVPEGAGMHAVPVRLSAPSGRTVQFSVATAFGSATANDVNVGPGPYTLPPGNMSAGVVVQIVQDTVAEGAESFTMSLGGVVNATIGVPGQKVVTIQDDD